MNLRQFISIKRLDYYNKRAAEENLNENMSEVERTEAIAKIIEEIRNLIPSWERQYPQYPYYQVGDIFVHSAHDKFFLDLETARNYAESLVKNEDDCYVIWLWEENVMPYVTGIVHDGSYFQRVI